MVLGFRIKDILVVGMSYRVGTCSVLVSDMMLVFGEVLGKEKFY